MKRLRAIVHEATAEATAHAAEQVAVTVSLQETLKEAETMLRQVGMEKLAMNCRQEQHKQHKRMRELSREDDGLLRALIAQRDHEAAVAAKRRRLAKEANDRTLALRDLKIQIRESEAALRASNEAAVAAEAALASKFALAQWNQRSSSSRKTGWRRWIAWLAARASSRRSRDKSGRGSKRIGTTR